MMPELPENVENAILDAELTPDEKLVAEEQAQEKLEPVVDIKPESEGPRDLPEEPQVDPQTNGKLPEHLVTRAKEFNFSDQELEAFDSPEHLEYWLNKFDNEMLNRFQQQPQEQMPQQEMPQQQMPQQEMPQEAPLADMQYDEYMDEGIKGNFETLQAQIKKQQELIDYMAYQGYQ